MIDYLYIDHIAYIFNEIEDGYKFFANSPGFRVIRGPGVNPTQGVKFLFITVDDISKIEILAPLDNKSPISSRLNNVGPSLYHICYAVNDLNKSINQLTKKFDWVLISAPKKDPAFDGRKVAFLKNSSYGIIELVESKIESFSQSLPKNISNTEEFLIRKNGTSSSENNFSKLDKSKQINLTKIIGLSVDNIEDIPDELNSFSDIKSWDSMAMAIFHSEFENLINKRITMPDHPNLDFYVEIYHKY
ncbi:MAG: VOC family protein [Prochlorococcus marinus XMU1425]|nr:VOC family protein [Prochlorococcus marinus XMU1425]MCR8534148.1 VOC family protein [Prochlorococcus marinus XMU1426]